MIRVLIAARSGVVRAGLESVVRSSASLELALELAGTAEEAADVLLMDAGGPEVEPPPLPTVALVEVSDAAVVSAALRAGVRGVISREASAEEIEVAVQAVHAGLVVMPPEFVAQLLPAVQAVAEALAEPLSERELEVLALLVEGLSNKLIAHRLAISEHTVKTHVTSILAKLGVASRTEAVSHAIRRGLVML